MAEGSSASAGCWHMSGAPARIQREILPWSRTAGPTPDLGTEISMTAQAEIAAAFHRLHHAPELLLLANAWDPGSARLIESLGARAVATTSAGVAWAQGYPDGDALPVPLLVS